MPETNINILLRLRDEFSASAKKVEGALKSISSNLTTMSNQLRMAGRNMIYLGGLITGAFGVALNTATKYSIEAQRTMDKFKTSITTLQITIATAVMPTINQLANIVGSLVKRFQELDPATRNNIMNAILLTGIWLTVGGTLMRVMASIMKLFALLSAHPALIIFIGLTILVIQHWQKLREVVIPIANKIEIALNMIAIGYEKVAKAMVTVLEWGARLAGQRDLADWFKGQKETIDNLIKSFEDNITKIEVTNEGLIAGSIESVERLIEEFRKLSTDFPLPQLVEKFDALKTVLAGTAREMTQLFGDLFFNALTGQLENAKQMFAEFGRTILKIITQALIRLLLIKTIGNISIFGVKLGGLFHQGGIVKAHSGLATDEVPIIAERGEGILSRRGMQALGRTNFERLNRGEPIGSGITYNPVIIIQAWDTRDIYRNRKMIESIIADAMERNSPVVRAKIKKYG